MKKKIIIILLAFFYCDVSFAESYYFNKCKISNAVIGNYVINLKKNVIEVELKAVDGNVQRFSDAIKSVKKDAIISEKIKSLRGKELYYQYFLNAKSKSVIKLQYEKISGDDFDVFDIREKRVSHCSDVKADWDKRKIDEAELNKEQKQILKEQEKIKKEQSALITCQSDDHMQWTNCKGLYQTETGHKYDGMFVNGKIIKGISLYPGGAKYVGEFKDYKPHGYGTFIWKNGDKYSGEWKNGKSNGSGTKIWKSGRKYIGEFKNDKLDGKGTLFYPDGKKYTGEFVNGKRHGEGTFFYTDGSAYIGNFLAGKEQGIGQCISKEGLSVPCKSKTDTQTQDFTGKDTHKISITAKKWIRISQYETNSKKGKKIMDKLSIDFENKAIEVCSTKGNYKILQKRFEVLELDETPAYGLEAKVKIAIQGVVECI